MHHIWLFIGCFSHYFLSTLCFCSNKKEWQSIPEDLYDRNFSSITSEGRRPLGFEKGTVYWDQQGTTNPCITIKDTEGKWLQILAETVPPSVICFKDQAMTLPDCSQQYIVSCEATPGAETTIEFSSEESQEADVTFWYRFTLSPPPSEMDPEMWCMNVAKTEYPGDLQPLPYSFTLRPTTPVVGDTANSLTSLVVLISSFVCLCMWLID